MASKNLNIRLSEKTHADITAIRAGMGAKSFDEVIQTLIAACDYGIYDNLYQLGIDLSESKLVAMGRRDSEKRAVTLENYILQRTLRRHEEEEQRERERKQEIERNIFGNTSDLREFSYTENGFMILEKGKIVHHQKEERANIESIGGSNLIDIYLFDENSNLIGFQWKWKHN